MTRRLLLTLTCAATLAVSLGGCGNDVRETLGMTREAPDEFRVVSRPPLSLPPNFTLRPPEPGAPPPAQGSAPDMGRSALIGGQGRVPGANGLSGGEQLFLSAAGADRAPSDIRTTINRESTTLAEQDRTFTDRLVFWREPEAPGTIVDAAAESRRIREGQAIGDGVTTGETPVIERRQRGMFEGIFGR